MIDVNDSKYGQEAMKLFLKGYNCSQSVFLAFKDLYDIDESTALKLSSSFGGGMGKLREVCGAVSGMFMVCGILYGYDDSKDYEAKCKHYERIQYLAKEFEKENKSIICRELLGLSKENDTKVPEKRTNEYYKKRPCKEITGIAAAIMEDYLKKFPK